MKKKEEKHFGKKYVGKSTIVILNQLNIKKNSTKIILRKKHMGKHCSKTKTMWIKIVTIHSVLKKTITKQN